MTLDRTRRWVMIGSAAAGLSACGPSVARPAVEPELSGCGPAPDRIGPGFDRVGLEACLAEFQTSEINFHGLAIWRSGAGTAERYRTGRDETVGRGSGTVDFDACQLHDIRSITKSVVSLLWGIAEGQGLTPSLDTTVLSLYPELSALAREGREAITIRHLLMMSTGLEWNEADYGALSNPETALFWRTSQVRHTFDRELVAPPGSTFNYCGGNTAVLADLLIRFTGRPLPQFAEEHLFGPLDISNWAWVNDYRGRPLAFAGLRLAPRDLLTLGRLLVSGGLYEGRPVVPAAWIEASTTAQIATGDGLQYGYQWWLGDVEAQTGNHRYVAGFGNGGQRLFVVPDLALVVAVTAGNYGRPEQRLSGDLFRKVVRTINAA